MTSMSGAVDRVVRLLPMRLRRVARLALVVEARQDALHEWRRARAGHPPTLPRPVRRVVFYCHGNICRSPFAGALLERQAPGIEVRTAGLNAREGDPAEPQAIEAARRAAIDLGGHAAHRLAEADIEWADLLLGMEGRHLASLYRFWPRARGRAFLLGDFLDAPPYGIRDPWGQPDRVFDEVFAQVRDAVAALALSVEERGS